MSMVLDQLRLRDTKHQNHQRVLAAAIVVGVLAAADRAVAAV